MLGELVRQGFIVQRPGARDRRQRLLELTPRGASSSASSRRTSARASPRPIARPARAAVEGFRKVMLGIIVDGADRRRFDESSGGDGKRREGV